MKKISYVFNLIEFSLSFSYDIQSSLNTLISFSYIIRGYLGDSYSSNTYFTCFKKKLNPIYK